MTAQKVVHVNWQESPDEEDVGGLILTMRGRRLTTEEAGKRNTRIIRKSRAVAKAKTHLAELLTVQIAESDGVPVGAEEVVAARAVSKGGYGSRYYMTLDGRLIQSHTGYDGPQHCGRPRRRRAGGPSPGGLEIKESELPRPERHAQKAP